MRPGIFATLLTDAETEILLGDAARAAVMVAVERALARVEGRLGVIDAGAAEAIEAALADFAPDLEDLVAGTGKAGVPVPALVAQLRRAVGEPAATYVHWGATSQDIVDTALVLQLRQALEVLEGCLDAVIEALAALAERHRDTVMLGRTRFQQAVPTSFGLKAAGWLIPLLRHRERLRELEPRLFVLQFGGAAGNLSALGDRGIAVMEALAAELDLACPPMPWHSQRDGLAELAGWLALVAGSLGKLGQDVLLLAQNEVGEVREAAGGGSSTMPQKANPIRAEALVTLARRTAVLVGGMHEAALHAHERDGAAWQLEWTVLPEMVVGAAAALRHAGELARTLVVDAHRMRANLDAAHGLPLAEAVRFALLAHMPRNEVQRIIEGATKAVLETGDDLVEQVSALTAAPVDWVALRAMAERPPAARVFIDRVRAAARQVSRQTEAPAGARSRQSEGGER